MSLADRLARLVAEVARGDDPESPAPAPSASAGPGVAEEGMIPLVTCFAMLLFVVLLGLVFNVGRVINAKIEVQDAGDAVAEAGATWMGRGLNAVTATNHLMGEVMALVVLHEAIGGP